MPREHIILECTEARNEDKSPSRYMSTRNKKLQQGRLNLANVLKIEELVAYRDAVDLGSLDFQDAAMLKGELEVFKHQVAARIKELADVWQ